MLKQYKVTLLTLLGCWLVRNSQPASNPTTHRPEHNWQYNYTVGLMMIYEKPKPVGAYYVLIWFLTF